MEGCTLDIQPTLTERVSSTDMAIMTRVGSITIKSAGRVTLGTDGRAISKVG